MSWWEVCSEHESIVVHADNADAALTKLDGALTARYVAGDHESCSFTMRVPRKEQR